MKKISSISALIILTPLLSAQVPGARLKMLVKDKLSGIPLTDTLVITIDDMLQRTMQSDSQGYLKLELPPGKHSIGAQHIGYQTTVMRGINFSEYKTTYITLALDNGIEEKPKKKKGGVKLKMKK
jgi:hypothetical protein